MRPVSGAPRSCSKCPRTSGALKFIKERVGAHMRTKGKQEELSHVLAAMRKAAAKD